MEFASTHVYVRQEFSRGEALSVEGQPSFLPYYPDSEPVAANNVSQYRVYGKAHDLGQRTLEPERLGIDIVKARSHFSNHGTYAILPIYMYRFIFIGTFDYETILFVMYSNYAKFVVSRVVYCCLPALG